LLLFFTVLGLSSGPLCMLHKCCISKLHPHPTLRILNEWMSEWVNVYHLWIQTILFSKCYKYL
jgi:hypothetical protein